MKNIAILGSTGSIGQNTLEVIRHFPDKFRIVGLSTDTHIELLCRQIKEFRPLFVGVRDVSLSKKIQSRITPSIKLFTGEDGLAQMVKESRIEKVVVAISGSAALSPLLEAIESGKQIALANKEALVMAGPIIMNKARKKKAEIIPVDSEQSAIWQCLEGEDFGKVKNIYLTASGGPLQKVSKKDLKDISVDKVLRHPRWKMGKKITVDSASLMNKGLEILETMFLFGIPSDKIKILIHPEAIIHSMVEFLDGVVLAQLSVTDMRIPIQYALTHPQRLSNSLPSIDFYTLQELHFQRPDFEKFPCLRLAYEAARQLGTMPCVLNAANEVCVEKFLKKELDFASLPKIIEKVLLRHRNRTEPAMEDVLEADVWARNEALRVIRRFN